ncbi:hypothetical protein APTCPA18_CDS20 [Pseudomonas phage APTC-PA18]|nr:hypothetical protein APTCPA18_CDS20 [Pseudomonas phage APTC-PA18]
MPAPTRGRCNQGQYSRRILQPEVCRHRFGNHRRRHLDDFWPIMLRKSGF